MYSAQIFSEVEKINVCNDYYLFIYEFVWLQYRSETSRRRIFLPWIIKLFILGKFGVGMRGGVGCWGEGSESTTISVNRYFKQIVTTCRRGDDIFDIHEEAGDLCVYIILENTNQSCPHAVLLPTQRISPRANIPKRKTKSIF